MLVVFSASFSLCNIIHKISSCVLCFFLVVTNLSFLPVIFVEKLVSFNFEKGKHPWNILWNSRKPFLFSKCCRFEFLFCCTLYEPSYHKHHKKQPYDFEQLVFYIFYMETLLAFLLFVILFIILIYFYLFIYFIYL